MTKKLSKQKKSTEEITDIVERMPDSFGIWVTRSVCLFALLFLCMGWVIKYPDTVTGEITISSRMNPIQLVAPISGKVHLFSYKNQERVPENSYIAMIENSASAQDVRTLSQLLEHFNPLEATLKKKKTSFPEKMSLGNMDGRYFSFLRSLQDLHFFIMKIHTEGKSRY